AVGLSTNLFPSFTLGCGAVGGSSTSDNVTPKHLFDIRRIAYDTGELSYGHNTPTHSADVTSKKESVDVEKITQMIINELKKMS
ncbi:MAG: acetaldehyde dehydrogenase (acetylating), partial [Moritella sp.]